MTKVTKKEMKRQVLSELATIVNIDPTAGDDIGRQALICKQHGWSLKVIKETIAENKPRVYDTEE